MRDVKPYTRTKLESSTGDRLDLYNTSDFDANSGIHSSRQRSLHHSMMFERDASSKENADGFEDYRLDLTEVVHSNPYDLLNRYSVSNTSALQHDFEYENGSNGHRKAVSLVQPSEVANYNDGMSISYPRHFQVQEPLSSEPPLYSEMDSVNVYYPPQVPYSVDPSNHHLRMYSSPVTNGEPIHSDLYLPRSYSLHPLSSLNLRSVDSVSFHGSFEYL